MFDIMENLKSLPDKPGVYMHKNSLGEVIYVGKALSLKNRVKQYFQSSAKKDSKLQALVSNIAEFEYIVCGSESEALILENNLIKRYMPKYNVLLRDDKTYPYIKITNEAYPRIIKTREVTKDKGEYFGPYSSASAVNQIVHMLNKVYKLKQCSLKTFPDGFRPCLNYHIGNCKGPCIKAISRKEYREDIALARDFLKGKTVALESYLHDKMVEASSNLKFEEAAKIRDYLAGAKEISAMQRVTLSKDQDMDMVLAGGSENLVLFTVREGKLVEREVFQLDNFKIGKGNISENVSAFIKQYYVDKPSGPKEILVAQDIESKEVIEEYLSGLWNHKVSITVPKRGEKKALLEMGQGDINQFGNVIKEKLNLKKERQERIRREISTIIEKASGMKQVDESAHADICQGTYRIEIYDISNTNGVDSVGGMVVFRDMYPEKKSYRKFKLKGDYNGDDYSAMSEVIYRRLKRGIEGDVGFLPFPDLIVLDGGVGHVSAVKPVLEALKVDIPVIGLVKDRHHRTRAVTYSIEGEVIKEDLDRGSLLHAYFGKMQEEVHRFAITYHRNIRDGTKISTALEEIPGIGNKKAMLLLKHFGSVDKIKAAKEEDLYLLQSITKKDAENIKKYFHK